MQKAAAMSTVSWISRSVAPCWRASSTRASRHSLAIDLDLFCDRDQRLQLFGDGRGLVVLADGLYEIGAAAVEMAGGGAVAGLAEVTGVSRRDEGGDQLAVTGSEAVVTGGVQQDVRELAHWLCGLGAKGEAGGDAWHIFR